MHTTRNLLLAFLTAAAALAVSNAPPGAGTHAAAFADGAGSSETTYASFGAGRVKDDLYGNFGDASKEVRIALFLSEGSRIDALLSPATTEGAAPASGLSLTLCNDEGTDLGVAGSKADKSKGDGVIRWKQVAIDSAGQYTLIVRATGAGGYRLKLGGTLATARTDGTASAVAPNEEREILFEGLDRGELSYALTATGPKGFVGELARIARPGGGDLEMTPSADRGKVTLDANGIYTLVYRNVGTRAGDAKLKAVAKPPRAITRRGFVRPEGTALIPVAQKLDPVSAFNKESALPFTIIGRDFQQGADVRLSRKGSADIIATNVVVRSETEIACTLDLDTTDTEGTTSVGAWTVAITNAPVYTTDGDPTTLVKTSPTRSTTAVFTSLSNAAIRLPSGVIKDSEVWFVDFNSAFQSDLDLMGLGSSDAIVRDSTRNSIEAYTIFFLRNLYRANATTGVVKKNKSVPISFIVEAPTEIVGTAGIDYNRIEVGGAWQAGDLRDVAEPLLWGFAAIDDGNATRNDLSLKDANGNRIGAGARTRVLDPTNPSSAQSWIQAMAPLRASPLTQNDRRYFAPGFSPQSQSDANRYRDIVEQITRASREIAAIIAHHTGKSMGVPDEGTGPMANPATSGNLWPTTGSLAFADGDIVSLIALAVPEQLPGTSRDLNVSYFPLLTTQAYQLPDLTTDVAYSASFSFVGGRPDAVPSDYRVFYAPGSEAPRGSLVLSYSGLSGTAPTMLSTNVFYCDIEYLRIGVQDIARKTVRTFAYRLNVLPNVALVPAPLQPQATACRNQVLATQ